MFTDGSSSGKAGFYSQVHTEVIQTPHTSAQRAELQALLCALLYFNNEPINIFNDSAYTVGVAKCIETGTIGNTSSKELFQFFRTLQTTIQIRQHPCFIGHIRAHSNLPGPLAAGNDKIDKLVAVCQQMSLYDCAQASHSLHHQNASTLHKKFQITRQQALQIVCQYPNCVIHIPSLLTGVNPHGLQPNQ